MPGVAWKKLKKLLKIPTDSDARGIVVRTLYHKYYLRPWTLCFIDPYVNVEFQTYMRRIQLERLRVVCVLSCAIPIYIGFVTTRSTIPSDLGLDEFMRFDLDAILAAVSTSYVVVLVGLLAAIHTRAAYVVNMPVAAACMIGALLSAQTILLSYSFEIHFSDTAGAETKKHRTPIWFSSAYNLMYRAFPMGTCMICIYVCFSVAVTVDVMAWYVMVSVCTLVQMFMLYEAHVVCGHDFRLLHEYFDAGITTHHIIGRMMGIPHDALVLGHPSKYLPLAARYITATTDAYCSNASAHTLDANPLYNVLQKGLVTPYANSVFDAASFDGSMRKQVIMVWVMFVAVMTHVVHQYNLSMRTIFILTRVRSNKDVPRNLDGGVRLQDLTAEHVDSQDRQIVANNLITARKSSTENDSSGNECVDERVKELELMATLEDLEMGERLSQLGSVVEETSAPNERAPSVATSGGLAAFAQSLVPPSYTQSVKSDGKDGDAPV